MSYYVNLEATGHLQGKPASWKISTVRELAVRELAPTMNFKDIIDDGAMINLKNRSSRRTPKQSLGAGTHGIDVQEVSLSGFNKAP